MFMCLPLCVYILEPNTNTVNLCRIDQIPSVNLSAPGQTILQQVIGVELPNSSFPWSELSRVQNLRRLNEASRTNSTFYDSLCFANKVSSSCIQEHHIHDMHSTTWVCMCRYTLVHMLAHKYAHMHMHSYTRMHPPTHPTHTHTHTHPHPHTHTHTHTQHTHPHTLNNTIPVIHL